MEGLRAVALVENIEHIEASRIDAGLLARTAAWASPFIFRPVVWLDARYSTDNQAIQQPSFYKSFLSHSLGCPFGSVRRGTRRAFVKGE
jgi:hypothetical protein